jgi:CubicO group peptidase (beta-lactamase class C family)
MAALASGQVVRPETYQQMITPARLADGSTGNYGYGLFVFSSNAETQLISIGVESSYTGVMITVPDKGLTIVLLSNTAIPGNTLLPDLEEQIGALFP